MCLPAKINTFLIHLRIGGREIKAREARLLAVFE